MNPLALLQLRAYLKTLVNMAAQGKPVETGAQFVYDKMPDEIVDVMALESWYELLEGVAPEVKPHKDWLTKTRDKALAMFSEGDEENDNQAA